MTTATTDIRDWKLSRAFAFFDVNEDGRLDQGDFRALADRMSSRLQPGDPISAELRAAWGQWWEAIAACHQGPSDRLDQPQWIAAFKALSGREGHEQIVVDALEGLFRFIDADSDGRFDLGEFERYYASFGGSPQHARRAFALLDQDGDDHISRPEFQRASLEFFFSADPAAPGNCLLGPPERH